MAVSGSTRPETWAPGLVIPGTVYRVIRPLGSGGMGDVYEVEHESLGLRRALKVLGRRLVGRDDLAERLRTEARALAGLRHPNLVEVHDLGVSSDNRVFFAMELLMGATLRELLERHGSFKLGQAYDVAAQLLDALGAAHARGMVHRDVKPENVFVQRNGVIKLLDFGVAKAVFGAASSAPQTAAGVAVGTPRYMAPEQAEGKPVDPRTDLYNVGLLLWEMLAGKNPFADLDHMAAAVATVLHGVPPLEEVGCGHLPAEVRAVVRKATQRRPDDRYADAASFAAELRTWRQGAGATLVPPSAATPSRDTRRALPGTMTRLDPIPVGAATELTPVDYNALGAMARPAGASLAFGETLPASLFDRASNDFRNAPTRTSFGAQGAAARPAAGVEALSQTSPPVAAERRPTATVTVVRAVPLPFWLFLPAMAALSSLVTIGLVRPPAPAAAAPCLPSPAPAVAALPAGGAAAALAATAPGAVSAAVTVATAPPPTDPIELEPSADSERRGVRGARERHGAAGRGRAETKAGEGRMGAVKAAAGSSGKALPGYDGGDR
jgi:serine/threonine protein kinase